MIGVSSGMYSNPMIRNTASIIEKNATTATSENTAFLSFERGFIYEDVSDGSRKLLKKFS
jgi:hypothetical protein